MLEVDRYDGSAEPSMQTSSVVLDVVRKLFDEFHKYGVSYCHWKSNEHIDAAVQGLTDLDLLVDPRCNPSLQIILAEAGYKRFAATPLRAYPGVEDYLAFDDRSGRVVHLHLHYQLTLGQRHLKGYRLPWEHAMLNTRVLDPVFDVYVSDPAVELVLLLVRAVLKRRVRDRLRRGGARMYGRDALDFQREFTWLHARADTESACAQARELIGPAAEEPLRRLLADPAAPGVMTRFAAAVRPRLQRYRTYDATSSVVMAWFREFHWALDAVNRRYLHRPVPLRRVSPRGGTVIALLGSDGSGKSGLSKTLTAWLGGKLDVMPVYLGSGDGSSSVLRLPFQLVRRSVRQIAERGGKLTPVPPDAPPTRKSLGSRTWRMLRAAAYVPWALALSLEKRQKLRSVTQARNRGMIVVCDRYPQAQFPGFNDGPLLNRWSHSRWSLMRWLAAWEARPYVEARQNPPDLVIKLAVTAGLAHDRRPEMTMQEIGRRIEAVRSIEFPTATKVVEVDSSASLEDVALAAKRLVWERI